MPEIVTFSLYEGSDGRKDAMQKQFSSLKKIMRSKTPSSIACSPFLRIDTQLYTRRHSAMPKTDSESFARFSNTPRDSGQFFASDSIESDPVATSAESTPTERAAR